MKNNAKTARPMTENGRKQTFAFAAPEAMSVQLVGDFTRWQQQPIGMQKDKDGVWKTSVELSPGAYQYRFLVDGEWRDDPECRLHVPNPFGGQDAVCRVA